MMIAYNMHREMSPCSTRNTITGYITILSHVIHLEVIVTLYSNVSITLRYIKTLKKHFYLMQFKS